VRLRFFNTLGRRKQIFRPIKDGEVGMYCCGPTVYDYAHIGNLRTYVCEDVIRRVLELNGYRVLHVMNVTDVGHLTSDADTGEDKVEMAARRERRSAWEIAKYYTDRFFEDTAALNILRPHIVPRATEHVKEMVELVKRLEEKGHTYAIEDGVYFDTSKVADYGKLTGMSFAELSKYLKAGARVELVPGKNNITDFALWKFSPKGVRRQMEWSSPWGVGFPGWHIECSAMSMKYLGETFDIHCGGIDHIPIHHTNEIAQSEAATGKNFVNYWLHCEFLLVEGERMSKSLGNYYILKDLLDRGYNWREVRFLFLSAHYRTPMNFTFESLNAARASVQRIADFLRRLRAVKKGRHRKEFTKLLHKTRKEFLRAVNDDVNMPRALAAIFSFISSVNKMLDSGDVTRRNAEKAIELFFWFDRVLGLRLEDYLREEELPEEVRRLIEERERARREKNYALADRIREEIREKYGIILEDTKEGVVWKRVTS